MKNIAIFASGTGSNAQKLIDHFRDHSSIKVGLIVSNNPEAGVLEIAAREDIPVLLIQKEKFFNENSYLNELKEQKIDFIILAGFLWKLPSRLIAEFPHKILNLHPALLPKYGGKGMYGERVHRCVLESKEKLSGISIHFVDDLYDHGEIIFQATCAVEAHDTPQTLAEKIHKLEHSNYPRIVEEVITNSN
jgi:phosphoribosylglycinamide formyltransferase-1